MTVVKKAYGLGMGKCLPYGGFKWLRQKEIDRFDVNWISENSLIGYILGVDLEYPDELHELHNDYALAPEKLKLEIMRCQIIAKKLLISMA